jgi:hypothetical protein
MTNVFGTRPCTHRYMDTRIQVKRFFQMQQIDYGNP